MRLPKVGNPFKSAGKKDLYKALGKEAVKTSGASDIKKAVTHPLAWAKRSPDGMQLGIMAGRNITRMPLEFQAPKGARAPLQSQKLQEALASQKTRTNRYKPPTGLTAQRKAAGRPRNYGPIKGGSGDAPKKWTRIEDGYKSGNHAVYDNGGGLGRAKGSGRWAVEINGKWVKNVDTLEEAKNYHHRP